MNDYLGYTDEKTESQLKAKKNMKIVGIILLLLFIMFIALIAGAYYIQSKQLKIYVNGQLNSQIQEAILIDENGKILVPIRKFAKYMGYSSYKGDYKQYEEDYTKCYVESKDELASFSANSNKIYKLSLKEDDYEYYTIKEPVILSNQELYTTIEGAEIAFNIKFSYNTEKNTIVINTLPYLTKYYSTKFTNTDIATKEDQFNNQKALLYGMVVVKNENNHYGVYGIDGKEIVGMKFANMKFIESTKEFIVETAERKKGIIQIKKSDNKISVETKISPEYDSIKQIDKDAGLYLVSINKKQGVVNNLGSYVVYPEYDQIGIDSNKYPANNIKNKYLLYNNCIPVRKNQFWGMFDKTGKTLLETTHQELGCIAINNSNENYTANSTLLIPKYELIVVKDNDLYGIYKSNGEQIIRTALTSVYSITSKGEDTYYMVFNDEILNVIDYIDKYILNTNKNSQPENNIKDNQNNME